MLHGVSFDALVVLGCRVQDGQLSAAARRRVERAALAFHEQGARLVITSGGKLWQGVMEADAFARSLLELGVPGDRLLSERESLTTRGNARGVERLLREQRVGSVGLVTCDWHMPRALRLFRRVGLHPIPVPAAAPVGPLYLTTARFLRERGSLVLDLVLAAGWSRA
jgi:uncharacterized SAM-binding protein YcdF (DUF218 family)